MIRRYFPRRTNPAKVRFVGEGMCGQTRHPGGTTACMLEQHAPGTNHVAMVQGGSLQVWGSE
jgi:hypothetical protein